MKSIASYSESLVSPTQGLKLLALFWFFNSFILNFFLSKIQEHTVLETPYAFHFLTNLSHDGKDSWLAMSQGLQYLREHENALLYEHVFFEEGVKFQYPPTSLLFLEPFQKRSYNDLLSVLNFLGGIGVLLIGFFSLKIFLTLFYAPEPLHSIRRSQYWLWVLLFLGLVITFFPIIRSWRLGQIQTFLILLYTLAIYAYIRRKAVLSGVLIGLICTIKPPLALLAIWGMIRREWKFVGGIFVVGTVVLLFSLYLYGWQNHLDYISVLSYIGKRGEVYYPNQSVNGLLNRLLENGSSVVWTSNDFPPYHPIVYYSTLVSSLLLIIAVLATVKRKTDGNLPVPLLDFFIASLSFTMATPIAWEHHYGIIFPILACILAINMKRSTALWEWLLLMVSYMFISNFLEFTLRWTDSPQNIIQSYVFGAALLLLGYFYWMRSALYRFNTKSTAATASAKQKTSSPDLYTSG